MRESAPMLVRLFIAVLVYASIDASQIREQDKRLYEGEDCKLETGAAGTCKVFKDCPKAVEEVKHDNRPQICGFKRTTPMICCEAQANPTAGVKSREICEKYADYVFLRLPDPLSGGVSNYDTCAIGKTTRAKRIVNGHESRSREYPHLALLGYKGRGDELNWFCGGSLISEQFVLTSAQCTDKVGSPKVVRLGDFNIRSETDDEKGEAQPSEYGISEIIIHPDYKPPSKYNDIALLKLNSTVKFTEFIRPICLHTQHALDSKYGLAAGWGNSKNISPESNILQAVNLTFYSHEECYDTYRGGKISEIFKDGISEATMICAGDVEQGKDTCQGDTGTPLQVPLQEPYCMYSQVGITSFGIGCGLGFPSVYTKVSYYIPWIENIVWPSHYWFHD